ncbi:MAG: AsmA family protein [Desulfosarcina sp.]|nr:AsmA family protein [Desulfobacterales bacterium]
MNRMLKWILIAGGVMVILLVAAMVLVPLLVDVNHYKPRIEARVREATGRPFQIGGNIDLSLFPWIGLALSDLHLGSPAGFGETELLKVSRFEARVRLMPLLSKKIEIKRLILEGPAITLVKKKDGQTNWAFETPSAPDGEKPARPETPTRDADLALASLTAEEIAIRNGKLTYLDEASGRKQEIADLTLVLKDVSLDRPLRIQFSTRINGQPLKLAGTVGPLGNPPASQPLAYDLTLSALDELDLKLTGSARNLKSQPVVALTIDVAPFSPRRLFERLGQPFPVQTADPETLQALSFKARLNGGPEGVKLEEGQMTLDQSRIDFSAAAAEFDKPRIDFDARIDDIDIDRYLPAQDQGQDRKKTIATPPAASKAPEKQATVDYAPLRRLVLDAHLNVAKLKVNQARLQNIALKITGRNGRFKLEPFTADLYGGKARIEGLVDVSRKQPRSNLSLALTDMLIGPFLKDVLQKDLLEGRLVTAIDLRFAGDRSETIRRTLNGKGRLTFNDGAIVGIDVAGMVRNLQTAFGSGEQPAEKLKTDFTELDIPFVLTNGVFKTAASNMKSPLLRLLAKGQADLVSESLDFRINPKFVATLAGQGDAQARSGVMVPVLVSGSFDQPEFKPDLKGIARQQVEEQIIESDQFKKVFEENEEFKPFEDTAKDLLKGLFD